MPASSQASSSKLHPQAQAQAQAQAKPTMHPPPSTEPAQPAKLAKNKRLPATMITPSGSIAQSKKTHAKDKQASKKQKARMEKGKERAVELAGRLEEKVKGREERKAKRNRAKNAWE